MVQAASIPGGIYLSQFLQLASQNHYPIIIDHSIPWLIIDPI